MSPPLGKQPKLSIGKQFCHAAAGGFRSLHPLCPPLPFPVPIYSAAFIAFLPSPPSSPLDEMTVFGKLGLRTDGLCMISQSVSREEGTLEWRASESREVFSVLFLPHTQLIGPLSAPLLHSSFSAGYETRRGNRQYCT